MGGVIWKFVITFALSNYSFDVFLTSRNGYTISFRKIGSTLEYVYFLQLLNLRYDLSRA